MTSHAATPEFDESDLRVLASGLRKVLATEWPRSMGIGDIARDEAVWEGITPAEIEVMERLDRLAPALRSMEQDMTGTDRIIAALARRVVDLEKDLAWANDPECSHYPTMTASSSLSTAAADDGDVAAVREVEERLHLFETVTSGTRA